MLLPPSRGAAGSVGAAGVAVSSPPIPLSAFTRNDMGDGLFSITLLLGLLLSAGVPWLLTGLFLRPGTRSRPPEVEAAVAEGQLPVTLPQMADFKPTGTPEPPLSKAADWPLRWIVRESAFVSRRA